MNIILIVKNNIKNKKIDMTVLFLLVTIAVMLFYAGISVLFNMGKAIDKVNDLSNGADYTLITDSEDTDEIFELMKEQKGVETVERLPGIFLRGFSYYNPDQNREKQDFDFAMEDMEAEHNIAQVVIADKAETKKENAIVLPYYMKSAFGYKTGDRFVLESGEDNYQFEVYGFVENVLFSTPTNISIFKCYTTNTYLEKLSPAKGASVITTFHAKLAEGNKIGDFEDTVSKALEDNIENYANQYNVGLNYESMKAGTAITGNIVMAVAAVFAIMLTIVAMVVIRFSIQNAIEGNLKNIGMLQANGYTSIQLMFATVLETVFVSLLGICGGLAGSLAVTSFVGNMIAATIGMRWLLGFDVLYAVISCLVILLLILGSTVITSAQYRKITPLNALREGIHTHNFKKNRVSLHCTRLPLLCALSMKNIWVEKKKNAAVCSIVIILSFACNMGFCLYENFVNDDKMIEISGMEVPTTMLVLDSKIDKSYDEIGNILKQSKITEEILYEAKIKAEFRYGKNNISSICQIFDEPERLHTNTIIQGRMPKYDNEVAISVLMCEELGAALGDVIYVENNRQSQEYIISGVTQHIEMLGKKGILTFEGAKRLNENIQPGFIYAYGKEGVDFDEIKQEYSTLFPKATLINAVESTETSMASVSNAMNMICIFFVICTLAVVIMVILFLVKAKLIREKRTLGINKALGFTTGQLIVQMVMSYIPVVAAGSVAGAIAAYFLINPVVVQSMSFAIKKFNMDINIGYMILTAAGMIGVSAIVVVLCALPIRKIDACRMIRE